MSTEGQLFTNIQNSIRLCATLTTIEYGHPKINQIASNRGFPVSPETREEDRKLDSYVLMTDAFRLCLHHLTEARKQLLLLGIQHELYEDTPTIYNPSPNVPPKEMQDLALRSSKNHVETPSPKPGTFSAFNPSGTSQKPSPYATEPYYNPRTDSDDEEEASAEE